MPSIGLTTQAVVPSKAWMAFPAGIVISWRLKFGRIAYTVNGISVPWAVILPVILTDFIDCHLAAPPLAWRFLAMMSSTVGSCAAAGAWAYTPATVIKAKTTED